MKNSITFAVALIVSVAIPLSNAHSQQQGQETLTPEEVKEQQAFAIGTQAYVWGYPLIVAEGTRRSITSVTKAQEQKAPTNRFAKARTLYGPEYKAVQYQSDRR